MTDYGDGKSVLGAQRKMDEELKDILTRVFGPEGWHTDVLLANPGSPRQLCLFVDDRARLLKVLKLLRDHPDLRFNQLIDLTAADYLNFPHPSGRFAVIYSLLSIPYNRRLWVKVMLNEPDLAVPSVTDLWGAANWLEREVYDMFGIVFTGHPNLRRILTPDNFVHYPLRKDYPVTGLGERDNFPCVGREDA